MITTETRFDGALLQLTLDAPKANILDREMIIGIRRALETQTTPHTKLVVFEGAGRHFSFGASVQEHQAAQAPAMLETFHALFSQLAQLAIPTCAVIRGQCLGGGLELASWCSFIVASPEAKLGQPEIQLGVFAPMASVLLPWRAGGAAALDLCLTGRSVGADEALRLGVIDAIAEDPRAWCDAHFVAHLQRSSASSLRLAERAVRQDLLRRLRDDLPNIERMYLDELMVTHDANEGIAAFMERRPPHFKNT